MMAKALVSVIIPTKNSQEYIKMLRQHKPSDLS